MLGAVQVTATAPPEVDAVGVAMIEYPAVCAEVSKGEFSVKKRGMRIAEINILIIVFLSGGTSEFL